MNAYHEMSRRNTIVKRAIVMAISVLLALIVAAPIASGQSSSQSQTIGKLTGDWWNWAVSTNPSPLEGSYKGGTQCDGSFVDGVFFLGGSQTNKAVKRTCTVPANTPILFPIVNTACGAAPTIPDGHGGFTGDPRPYNKCANDILDQVVLNSTTFATLNGQPLEIQRLLRSSQRQRRAAMVQQQVGSGCTCRRGWSRAHIHSSRKERFRT